MEFYPVEMIGVAAASLLYWLFLLVTGRKDRRMAFISIYLFAFVTVSLIVKTMVHEPDFVMMLAKCLFLPLFVVLYLAIVERHPDEVGRRILTFLAIIGMIPLLSTLFIAGSFWLSALFGHSM